MLEKQEEIIKKIDELEEIKKYRQLAEKLNSNENYLNLMEEFEKNKEEYIKNDVLRDKIIELRKKIFEIDELKEYLKLESDIRLLSIKISNIISSVVDVRKC